MDELTDIYKRIEYLRNNGVKMKEIADRVDMAPSVLSALYSSVLPAYIDLLKTRTPDEALDEALALVNNVSKKRLLNNVGSVRLLLQEMEPDVQSEAENGNSFIKLLGKEAKESVQEVYNYSGMYLSYSLSSSTDSLKIEPYMICASENNEYVKVGMINAYKSVHWGSGIISNHQNSYLMFNERDLPQFALVTIYLQLPHYEFPNMLKGLYLCLDYNHNPIARRIVLVKQSDSTDVNQFLEMEGCLVPRAELTPELEVYYNYTCQEGDYIKTCTVPSPKLDETDLEREEDVEDLKTNNNKKKIPDENWFLKPFSSGMILFICFLYLSILYSLEEESQNIIEVSPYQQTEEQNHTGHLGVFHKLVARFAAGYHLVEEEEHVATV